MKEDILLVWQFLIMFTDPIKNAMNRYLAVVAPGIAEALIATAMGLFAAIPAVIFYNRFTNKVERLENAYANFMDEFTTILNRQIAQQQGDK